MINPYHIELYFNPSDVPRIILFYCGLKKEAEKVALKNIKKLGWPLAKLVNQSTKEESFIAFSL